MIVEFTSETKSSLKVLSKKYPRIYSDVQPIIDQLKSGDIIGDQIPGTQYTVFKVRVKNSDTQKGKRSGYRIVYNLRTNMYIIIVTIYSKLNQSDISAKDIKKILKDFDEQ